jgi:hypothetical protein
MSQGKQISSRLVPGILLMLGVFFATAWIFMELLIRFGWEPLGDHRFAFVAVAFALGGLAVLALWQWIKKQ